MLALASLVFTSNSCSFGSTGPCFLRVAAPGFRQLAVSGSLWLQQRPPIMSPNGDSYGPQRLVQRGEWSDGGTSRLLQAYEAKWLLRNRAKLKWSDWVDIASDVSAHCTSSSHKPGHGGSAKTPNQCKNKVESMKKRYRAESAVVARAGTVANASSTGTSWWFFRRMDGLLKGPLATSCSGQVQTEVSNSVTTDLSAPAAKAEPEVEVEAYIPALRQHPSDMGPTAGALSDLLNAGLAEKADQVVQKESVFCPSSSPCDALLRDARATAADPGARPPSGDVAMGRGDVMSGAAALLPAARATAHPTAPGPMVDARVVQDMHPILDASPGAIGGPLSKKKESNRAADSDAANASSPRSKDEANGGCAEEAWDDVLPSRKRKGSASSWELNVARSIELLASSFVKIERARMEIYRETERIRAEAEVQKGETELKRTEIMAKTHLQIARLFAKRLKEFSGNGKNGGSSSEVDTLAKKGENG
ncbi:unnamed protein product [Alopecurus aequalis]